MKRPLCALVLLLAAAVSGFGAGVRSLTPEKFRAAGLHKLTEAELAALEDAIEELAGRKVAAVQDETRQALAAAEARVQAAEKKAEQKAEAAPRSGPNWFRALITLEREGISGSEEMQSTLKGTLKTFRGRRSFALANGQVWQMIEDESYAGPAYVDPAVFIRPGTLGTFWLRIPDAGLRFKVKPVRLE